MERSAPWSISRLSEMPSLLDLRHTLGNDSVLQCALHQYLNGSHWYSVFEIGCSNTFNPFLPIVLNTGCYSNISHRGTSARCGQIRYSKRAAYLFLFRASIFGYGRRRSAYSKGNRSSPLYAICLNWIHGIQFVDFDSKLFYGRHCQIEPDGEHPTSIERNRRHLSIRL